MKSEKELEEDIKKVLREKPEIMNVISPLTRRLIQKHVLKKGSEKADGCGG